MTNLLAVQAASSPYDSPMPRLPTSRPEIYNALSNCTAFVIGRASRLAHWAIIAVASPSGLAQPALS